MSHEEEERASLARRRNLCMCTYVYTGNLCVCVYIHMCTGDLCMCIYVYIYVWVMPRRLALPETGTYVCIYGCAYVYICIPMYTYGCIYVHV
jgi:hypothetical protein